MNEGSTMEANGVIVPPEAVAHSNEVKASRRKSPDQIPAFRAAANLFYTITKMAKRMPNKDRKFSDVLVFDGRDLMKTILDADMSYTDKERVDNIKKALSLTYCLKCYIRILAYDGIIPTPKPHKRRKGENQLAAPRIDKIDKLDKDTSNKIDALIRSIIAQLVAWRENPRGQGAPSSPTLKK